MKIAISTSVIARGKSGVGQYVLSLVRGLMPAAQSHDFTLFTLEEDLPLFAFAAGAMRVEPVAERHRPALSNIRWHQTEFARWLRRERFDLAHVPSYRRLLWRQPCALVATIHDLAPFRLAGKYDPLRMFYGRVVARRLARRQHEIIAVSQMTADDVKQFFQIPSERVAVVPNGIDHSQFKPGEVEASRRRVCDPRGLKAPFFLYVARLEHPAKNHVRLVTAFNQFKARTGLPWRLVLGGTDWHGAEEIHKAVEHSPYRGHIVRLGFVPDRDLPHWYRSAEGLVFPSLYEGFGLPPIEAMACACPVLSSRRGALTEVVGDAAGVLEPEDPVQMADAMIRFAQDPAERRRLRTLGLVHAQRYDWRLAAIATLTVYERAHRRYCAVAGGADPGACDIKNGTAGVSAPGYSNAGT
ncbi:MAG TPA: glycosyltransferase family 1 protein [Opitutaceae bacterium]|jgi:glycosyltransferase involved in cell wall biosynthesis